MSKLSLTEVLYAKYLTVEWSYDTSWRKVHASV